MWTCGTSGTGVAARALRRTLALAITLCGVAAASAADAPASRVPKPAVAIAAPGQCVEETQFMLRNHMDLLKHHRDLTVHEGVRTTRHSLANCVACHASPETGRVTGSKEAFCEGCHRYAAVKLDCFGCHSDRAPAGIAAITTPIAGPPQGANSSPVGGSERSERGSRK